MSSLYCENCYKEGLNKDNCYLSYTGGVYCNEDCFIESKGDMIVVLENIEGFNIDVNRLSSKKTLLELSGENKRIIKQLDIIINVGLYEVSNYIENLDDLFYIIELIKDCIVFDNFKTNSLDFRDADNQGDISIIKRANEDIKAFVNIERKNIENYEIVNGELR
jgi:hypothetical protein